MKTWLITGLFIVVTSATLFICRDSLMRKSFDAKHFSSSSKTMKFRMALDLIDKKRLNGMPIDMVKANLGKPDFTAPYSISYTIDEPLGYRDTLTIRIDNGSVSKVFIHDSR